MYVYYSLVIKIEVHRGFNIIHTMDMKYNFRYNCLHFALNVRIRCHFISAPEPKAQVHYCDHALSVVRPSVRPSLTFHIFNFSSETTEQNSTKLDRMQELNILYQVCVFPADWKNKMAALASDWLRHFRLLL